MGVLYLPLILRRFEGVSLISMLGYTIVRILQRFEGIARYWQDDEAQLRAAIVLSPPNGVRVGFWEAKH